MSSLDLAMDETLCLDDAHVFDSLDWAGLAAFRFLPPAGAPEFPAEEQTPPDKFLSFANYQPEAYRQARSQALAAWRSQAALLAHKNKHEVDAHFARALALHRVVLDRTQQAKANTSSPLADDEFLDLVKRNVSAAALSVNLPGRDPRSWPVGLELLVTRLSSLPPFALWLEPFDSDYNFFAKACGFLKTSELSLEDAELALKALLLVGYLSGNGTKIALAHFEVYDFCRRVSVPEAFVKRLQEVCVPHQSFFRRIMQKEQPLNYVRPGSLVGSFAAAHNLGMQKNQNLNNTSLTTDGHYLYLFVGSGGKFKIGTGEGGTRQGKVYLHQPPEKPNDISWVYCRGKLYMRVPGKDSSTLHVLCPKTFKTKTVVQLHCPELFGTQQQRALNSAFPLLTDGDSLYVIGINIETQTEEHKEENKEESKEESKGENKPEPDKKESRPSAGICQFVLHKFEFHPTEHLLQPTPLLKELFEGFSCFFSLAECQQALSINQFDIEAAANWLVEHGEKQRGKQILLSCSRTLLCEAPITSSNLAKVQKPEVSMGNDAVLAQDTLHRGCWTLAGEHVAMHLMNRDGLGATAKVFSIRPDAVKRLAEKAHVLPGTMNQVAELIDQTLWDRYLQPSSNLRMTRGSHIENRVCDSTRANERALVYDPIYKRYYSVLMNWPNGLHFLVFADHTRVDLEPHRFSLGPLPHEQMLADSLNLLQECEQRRFSLPWRWSRWAALYSRVAERFSRLLKNSAEEEKTKLYRKLLEKLQSKIENAKFFEERALAQTMGFRWKEKQKRKKDDPRIFCLSDKIKAGQMEVATDSSPVTLRNGREVLMTLDSSDATPRFLLSWLQDVPELRTAGLQLLYMWATHSCLLLAPPLKSEVVETLSAVVASADAADRSRAWHILVLAWDSLVQNPMDEVRLFHTLLAHSFPMHSVLTENMLSLASDNPLVLWYLKYVRNAPASANHRRHAVAEYQQLDILVDKQNDQFTLKGAKAISFRPADQIVSLRTNKAHILFECWTEFSDALLKTLESPDACEAIFGVFTFLLKESVLVNQFPEERALTLLNTLFAKLLTKLTRSNGLRYQKWLVSFREVLSLAISQAQYSKNLLSLFTHIRRLFTVEGQDMLELLTPSLLEGPDCSQERLIESAHPYRKGKHVINQKVVFPGALAVCIETDPRSQTSSPQDNLLLTSGQGHANSSGDMFSNAFKLSGKIGAMTLFVQGSQLNVEFNANSHRVTSTQRWGVRLKAKPVYGQPQMFIRRRGTGHLVTSLFDLLGGRTELVNWLTVLSTLAYRASKIEYIPPDRSDSEILSKKLFRGGFYRCNIDSFLSNDVPEAPQVHSIPELFEHLPANHKAALGESLGLLEDFLERIRKLEPQPAMLRAEQSRKSFKYQEYWRRVELTALYVMLYHTRSLELSTRVNHYEERLRAYGRKLNTILTFMLREAHLDREINQLCADIQELKRGCLTEETKETKDHKSRPKADKRRRLSLPKPKTAPKPQAKQISGEDKARIFEQVSERYRGNTQLIEKMSVRLQTTADLSSVLEAVWSHSGARPDPYGAAADYVYARLLVLLYFLPALKSMPQMSPLTRASTTSSPEETDANLWVRAHKRWRTWKEGETYKKHSIFEPLQDIQEFIVSQVNLKSVLADSIQHCVNALRKLEALDQAVEVSKTIQSSPFKWPGLLQWPALFTAIEACGAEFTEAIATKAFELLELTVHEITSIVARLQESGNAIGVTATEVSGAQYLTKELRHLISFCYDLHLLLSTTELQERLAGKVSVGELFTDLVNGLLAVIALDTHPLQPKAAASLTVLVSTIVDAVHTDPVLSNAVVKALIELLRSKLDAGSLGQQESLLALCYDVVFLCGITQETSKTELSQLLMQLLTGTESFAVLRTLSKIARLIFPEVLSESFVRNAVSSFITAISSCTNKHLQLVDPSTKYAVYLHSTAGETNLAFLFPLLIEWEEQYPSSLQARSLTEAHSPAEGEWIDDFLGVHAAELSSMPQLYKYFQIERMKSSSGERRGNRSGFPTTCFTKLERIFEEWAKNCAEIKTEDTQEERERKERERAFNDRIRLFIKESQYLAAALMTRGTVRLADNLTLYQANALIQFAKAQMNHVVIDKANKLPLLPINPHSINPLPTPVKEITKLKKPLLLTVCEVPVSTNIEAAMEAAVSLPQLKSGQRLAGNASGPYAAELCRRPMTTGSNFSQCINEMVKLVHFLAHYSHWRGHLQALLPSALEQSEANALGALTLAVGWNDLVQPGSEVLGPYRTHTAKGVVVQGGVNSGLPFCGVVFDEDSSHGLHMIDQKELTVAPYLVPLQDLGLTCDLLASAVLKHISTSDLLFRVQLFKACSRLQWDSWVKQGSELVQNFLGIMQAESEKASKSQVFSAVYEEFSAAWEALIDNQAAVLPNTVEPLSILTDLIEVVDETDDGITGYALPGSTFLDMPQQSMQETDLKTAKMVRFWETHIIPRIKEFVRASFKNYEMDYYFEMIMSPLRSGNQHRAIQIVSIICEGKLPNGVFLPPANHDWGALCMDEVEIGMSAVARIEGAAECAAVESLLVQGVAEVPVIVRGCDTRVSALLLEYCDFEISQVRLFWLPICCVYPVTKKVLGSVHGQLGSFTNLAEALSQLYARKTILECMSALEFDYLSLSDLISAAVLDELDCSRINGWKQANFIMLPEAKPMPLTSQTFTHAPHLKPTPKLQYIQESLLPNNAPEVVELAVIGWHELANNLSEEVWALDLHEITVKLVGPQERDFARKLLPLHLPNKEFAGLAISFRKDAQLASNTALTFYADPQGQTQLCQLAAGARGRSSLPPLLFNTGEVWWSLSTQVASGQQSEGLASSHLKVRVHGLPHEWTETCWVTEAASVYLTTDSEQCSLLHSLTFALTDFLSNAHCSSAVRQILLRLLTRIVRRLRFVNSLQAIGLGIDPDWLQQLANEAKHLVSSQQGGSGTLYSSYIQDIAECLATCLLPWDVKEPAESALYIELPPWVNDLLNSAIFVNFFRGEGSLTQNLQEEVAHKLEYNQWSTVIALKNVTPEYHDRLLQVLRQYSLRVPNTESDIQYVDNHCVIFADGFSLEFYKETEFGEEHKAPEREEDAKEDEGWVCMFCTFINNPSLPSCEICMNPKTEVEPVVDDTDIVPHLNTQGIIEKLCENQAAATQELLTALTGALECEATLLTDSDLLCAALKQRTVTNGTLQPFAQQGFDACWAELKPVLGDSYESAQGQFISMAETDALVLFKTLESHGVDLWLQASIGVQPARLTVSELEALMEFMEFKVCQETKAVLFVPPRFLRLPMEETSSINYVQEFLPNELTKYSLRQLRYSWAVLALFNQYVSEAIGLCNLSDPAALPPHSLTLSLSSAFSEVRALVMLPIKNELQQLVFMKTAVHQDNPPNLNLERIQGEGTCFAKAFEQLATVNTDSLRPPKPQGTDPFIAFVVNLRGELVVGEAGPYRQFFADVSKELQVDSREFFIPIPNDADKEVPSKFIVNPSSASSRQLQMFEFLGLLMGCCARTGTKMTLDLAPFLWKAFVHQTLGLTDLTAIDTAAAERLKTVALAEHNYFEEEPFTCTLSDGSVIEFVPQGSALFVTQETRGMYFCKGLEARTKEAFKQSQSLRQGLVKLVPENLLNLFTWKQLEELVCGKPFLDIELLKRHTKLGGGLTHEDNRVVWLWEILYELSPAEQLLFVKFCWGQERLPINDEDFISTNTRFMLKPAMNSQYGDGALPKADTCFFNLELFEYSSKDVMKERLRYAILTDCVGLNGDNPVNEQQDAGIVLDRLPEDELGIWS